MSSRLRDPWEAVRDDLRASILDGRLAPGDRVLEVELATRAGTSRGPVREAIRALEREGLLVRRPRQGTVVVGLDAREVAEIFSLRAIVEPAAAARALAAAPRRLEASLAEAAEGIEAALASGDATGLVEHDLAFHRAFFADADHDRLLAIWEGLEGPLGVFMRLAALQPPDGWQDHMRGHRAILDAVRARDATALAAAIGTHLGAAAAAAELAAGR